MRCVAARRGAAARLRREAAERADDDDDDIGCSLCVCAIVCRTYCTGLPRACLCNRPRAAVVHTHTHTHLPADFGPRLVLQICRRVRRGARSSADGPHLTSIRLHFHLLQGARARARTSERVTGPAQAPLPPSSGPGPLSLPTAKVEVGPRHSAARRGAPFSRVNNLSRSGYAIPETRARLVCAQL